MARVLIIGAKAGQVTLKVPKAAGADLRDGDHRALSAAGLRRNVGLPLGGATGAAARKAGICIAPPRRSSLPPGRSPGRIRSGRA